MAATPTDRKRHRCRTCRGATAYVERPNDKCGYCVGGYEPPKKPRKKLDPPKPADPLTAWRRRREQMTTKQRWPTLTFGGEVVREFRVALPD